MKAISSKHLVWIVSMLLLQQCAVLQSVQGPVMRILRKGSCVAIDLPAITLTPARTAAERQLVGEDVQLERDGWLVASAHSLRPLTETIGDSRDNASEGNKAGIVRRYYIELGVLDFYEPALRHYRESGLLGEAYNGLVMTVPVGLLESARRQALLDERSAAIQVANAVNQARRWLAEFQQQKSDIQANYASGQEYREALPGEWIYTNEERWVRVK
ncbi:MAG: DUF1318 domain-containing protein [Leptospiraceae bacterium]|nr:DUF1318 domain-containing protein [Leptospiraceae bacterium]